MVKHLTSKIMLSIYLLVSIGLAIWGYTVFRERYKKESITSIPQSPQKSNYDINSTPPTPGNNSNTESKTEQQPTDTQTNQIQQVNNASPANSLTKITPEVCNNQCDKFKKDKTKLEYCQQVCGLSDNINKNVNNEDCSISNSLQRDYCLKNTAIQKHDSGICSQISDYNIQNTCINRVSEDLLEIEKEMNPRPNQAPEY